MKKKILYVIIAALILLIVTNPSQKAFKDYLGVNTYSGLRRTSNFLICSVYNDGDRYFAIAGNFFELKSEAWHSPVIDSIVSKDSAAYADSSKMADITTLPPPPPKYIPADTNSLSNNLTHIQKLYYNLLKYGYSEKNLGTESEFSTNIKDPKKATKLYNALRKDGFSEHSLGTLKEFLFTFTK
jgi:hypothetical protein